MVIECGPCNATGLYCGFAEPEGTAVICRLCNGGGGVRMQYIAEGVRYKEFRGRRGRRNVKRVFTDDGLWMIRKGDTPTVSISEFREKVPETEWP
ncbi:MAG: hypothetical protein ACXABY_00745 [Candidatus Thorarchaeota archaeon]|jgi:hypothetical protein